MVGFLLNRNTGIYHLLKVQGVHRKGSGCSKKQCTGCPKKRFGVSKNQVIQVGWIVIIFLNDRSVLPTSLKNRKLFRSFLKTIIFEKDRFL